MSRFNRSEISLKQLTVAGAVLVVVVGVIFWYSGGLRTTYVSNEQQIEESRRAEEGMRQASRNMPRDWLTNTR